MPPTATLQDIKAYLEKSEKGEISTQVLPPCPRCKTESGHFKIHAYRERRFLIIVDMVVKPVLCPLLRLRCPNCLKTVTFYPDFAIPYKSYTRQSVVGFAENYVASDATYQQAVMVEDEKGVPGYPDGEKTLAPSTVHRWVTTLSRLTKTAQRALDLICQKDPLSSICRDLAQWIVPQSKYRTQARKASILNCFRLLVVEALFKRTFHLSIFTKLAISCAFV